MMSWDGDADQRVVAQDLGGSEVRNATCSWCRSSCPKTRGLLLPLLAPPHPDERGPAHPDTSSITKPEVPVRERLVCQRMSTLSGQLMCARWFW
jgi:hypothetical protein